MTTNSGSTAPKPHLLQLIASSSVGTMLEYYDFFVYVALTSTLTQLFLPRTDALVASLLGVATFGIAYLARPLGTLIFNPMADRVGRKKAFIITLVLMGAATVGIGCLPTYSSIGKLAPLALLLLRILQGVALGGEYGSAVVYLLEHSPDDRKGGYTSILQGTATIGLLMALLLVTGLKLWLPATIFLSWGWRVPFLISAPVVLIATWIRLGMTETPVFLAMKREGRVSQSPLADTLGSRAGWKSILLGIFGAQGATSVSLYTSIVYMLYFLESVLKVNALTANLCLAAAIAVATPFYYVFGRLSDRMGRSRVMFLGIALWMLAAYPAFSGIRSAVPAGSWISVASLIAVLAVLTAMIMAPLPTFVAECFPPQSRATGFGLAQQLGNAVFGGFLPLISLSLVHWTGNDLAGLGYSISSLVPCLIVTYVWGMRNERTLQIKHLDGVAGI